MSALHIAVMLGAVFYLLRIAVVDFRTLRISNRDNLIMAGLALAALALRGPASLGGDLIAGGALFLLGLLFWLRGAMGAGDAKLFPSLGVLVGWQGLSAFAILLLAASILLLAAIKLGPRLLPTGTISRRLESQINQLGANVDERISSMADALTPKPQPEAKPRPEFVTIGVTSHGKRTEYRIKPLDQ
ncbi:MAG: A24 family peptidase [Paracoccaceae bacterium]